MEGGNNIIILIENSKLRQIMADCGNKWQIVVVI